MQKGESGKLPAEVGKVETEKPKLANTLKLPEILTQHYK